MKKYPRTFHFSFSPEIHSDDKVINEKHLQNFLNNEIIITEKIDGGNCASPETLITTNLGNKTIKEIVDNKLDCQVLSFNHKTHKKEFKEILNYFNNGMKDDWYEIEDELGNLLKLTSKHLVFVKNKNKYIKVEDLEINDEVLINAI